MSARTLLTLALVSCLAHPAAAAERSWLDAREAGRSLADLTLTPAISLPAGVPLSIPLPQPFGFRGARYDTLELGADPGEIRLAPPRPAGAPAPPGLLLRPAGAGLVTAPGSLLQVRSDGGLFALRLVGLRTLRGESASFDVLLEPGPENGSIVLQWLQAPESLRAEPGSVVVLDETRDDARAEPLRDGLALRAGTVVELPGDLPWSGPSPKTGCSIAPRWCDVVRVQDPGCYRDRTGDYATCATTVSQLWHFREEQYCRSCPYSFYVPVECGTEIHLPFFDMEGNQVRITNVFTGVEMELEALNDCAKVPFAYCDTCPAGGLSVSPTGTCTTGTRVECIPYLQRSTLVQWGFPLVDHDGDGVAAELPCGPGNVDDCEGARSGAWPAHESTNTDVIMRGNPALCGVYRIDVVSGGFDWYLAANCTGNTFASSFNIYQNCADALAAFDPVPELAITRLEFTGVCPDIELIVEVTNLGCVDAPASPVRLDFERMNQDDVDVDLGVVPAGTSVQRIVPVSLRATPQNVTALVDFANVLSECTEQAAGSFSGCAPTSGADTLTTTLCTCANTVAPIVLDDSLVACNGGTVAIDATGSSAVPCAGGDVEVRVTTAAGAVVRDWSPDPVAWLSPTRCPSLEDHVLEVRCSLETGADCVRRIPFTVECAAAPDLVLTSSASPVCQGDSVTISASPGFGTYVWDDGRAGPSFTDRPADTTTYRVTATTPSGCVAQGEVTVDVVADPMPGPVGASLRASKAGLEVFFSFTELPMEVGSYELLVHEPDGTRSPCGVHEPPLKPTPIAMQQALSVDSSLPGDPAPQLAHLGGTDTCPRLLFYKVVGTSPCRGTRGPACNGFPMQLLRCP